VSALTIVVAAAIIGLVVGAALLPAGVFWALPIALVLLGFLGVGQLRRRAAEARSMESFRDEADSEPIEFTERDKQTLVENEPAP
jgi:cytochrome c-type biogenesis protein CcmH/NrfF